MGTFSRFRYVIAANVNALIEKAEDPQKLLCALIREMEEAGEEVRLASAEMLAEQQHLGRFAARLAEESRQWQQRARKAVEEQRDDLARAALEARAEVTAQQAAVTQELASVGERIAQMEQDMAALKSKMAEAKLKLKNLYTKAPTAVTRRAATTGRLTPSEKRVRRALGRFDRLQTQVENLEARVRSYELGGPAAVAWAREAVVADPAVEEELRRLKQQIDLASDRHPEDAAV